MHGPADSQNWGTVCTFQFGADLVYVLDVAGAELKTPELEGVRPGEQGNVWVDKATIQATDVWQSAAIANVDLVVAPVYKTFLPAVERQWVTWLEYSRFLLWWNGHERVK